MNTDFPLVGIPPSLIPPYQPIVSEETKAESEQQTTASSITDIQNSSLELDEPTQERLNREVRRSSSDIAATILITPQMAPISNQPSSSSSSYSVASCSTSPPPTSPSSPLSSPTSSSLIFKSRTDRINEIASKIDRKQIPDDIRRLVVELCSKLREKKQIEELIKRRLELFRNLHFELNEIYKTNPTLENKENLDRLKILFHNAILLQRDLKSKRNQRHLLILTANLAKSQPKKDSKNIEAQPRIVQEISRLESLKEHLILQKNQAILETNLQGIDSLEKNIKTLDTQIKKVKKQLKLPLLGKTIWLKTEIERLSENIHQQEKLLFEYESEALNILGERDNEPILALLTRNVDEFDAMLQFDVDYLFTLGDRCQIHSPEDYQAFLSEIAMQFLRIGMWPPKPSQSFNSFRQDILQTMLNMAIEQYPPEFIGETSSGGVYKIFSQVEKMEGKRVVELVKQEIGCFKPEDEAPGERYARRPGQATEPGLDPETASIRQALISQISTSTTTDSILAEARHLSFKYFVGEPIFEEEGAWRPMTPEEYEQKNREALSDHPEAPLSLKFGVFMGWIHNGKSVYDIYNLPDDLVERKRLITQMESGEIEETTYYHRVFDSTAYLNWDPNIGNQLMTSSAVGIGQSIAWREIDMDKVFPKGFIAGTSRPFWGSFIPDIRLPLNSESFSEVFSELAQEHYRNIESIIKTCEQFWNRAIERKIVLISGHGFLEIDRQELIDKLQTLKWSEAHSDVLRATAVAMKVAADLKKTPQELFNLIDNTRVSPKQFEAKSIGEISQFYNLTLAQALELVSDLHVYNFPDESDPLYDIPSKLTHLFLLAKARQMNQPTRILQTREGEEGGEKSMDHEIYGRGTKESLLVEFLRCEQYKYTHREHI